MPYILIPSLFMWGTAWFVWLLKPGLVFAWRNPEADVLTSGCPWKLEGMRVRAICRDAIQTGISTKVVLKKPISSPASFTGRNLRK